jgi:hypothetical protein
MLGVLCSVHVAAGGLEIPGQTTRTRARCASCHDLGVLVEASARSEARQRVRWMLEAITRHQKLVGELGRVPGEGAVGSHVARSVLHEIVV